MKLVTGQRIAQRAFTFALGMAALFVFSIASADTVLPRPLTEETFADLKESSPFRRAIDYSDSLVFTGVARIEGSLYATLFDSESSESHVVSETPDENGWQLVDFTGDQADLESITAKIQVEGGEVVSIRYQQMDFTSQPGGAANSQQNPLSQEQIDDARRAARNPEVGFRGDGYRGAPPAEIMEKLKKITPAQREQLARRVMQMRNNGVESEVRSQFYREALDRAARGR
ncbi:MAG: hypothetical protein AAGF67_12480 [Verrucomicrobiota bacterium]